MAKSVISARRMSLATMPTKAVRFEASQWAGEQFQAMPDTATTAAPTRFERFTVRSIWAGIVLAGLALSYNGAAVAYDYAMSNRVSLIAITTDGESFVAGRGDTCASAFIDAEYPLKWRTLKCVSKF